MSVKIRFLSFSTYYAQDDSATLSALKTVFTSAGFSILLLIIITILICISIILYRHFSETAKTHRMRTLNLLYSDRLTRLPNWNKMKTELWKLGDSALAFFDVKSFKLYNELFGYEYGDQLLKIIADELNELSHKNIKVCRYEADCFALLLPTTDKDTILQILNNTFETLTELDPLKKISMRFACGVVFIDSEQKEMPSMLKDCANFARDAAKQSANTQIVFFDSEAKSHFISLQVLTGQLAAATVQNDFVIVYQPLYTLKDGKIIGAEALIRWQHPDRGLLMPDSFLPAFIENGSIEHVDRYILNKVLQQITDWQSAGIRPVPISVNFSRALFLKPEFAGELVDMLKEKDIDPSMLHVEITEHSLYGNTDTIIQNMQDLHLNGFSISMDDFGSAYSSLGLLRKLPLTIVKLDRNLIAGIETNEKQRIFVADIVTLIHHIGIKTLVEGVENKVQAAIMRATNCDYVQGFAYSRPLTYENFEKLLIETSKTNYAVKLISIGE